MSIQTIFCVLIILDELYRFPATAYVSSTSAPSCSPVVNATACPHGYLETPSPRACVTAMTKLVSNADAKKYCANLEPPYSSMWISYNSETTKQMKELMKVIGRFYPNEKAWLDLSDEKQEGTWLWSNGQELRKNSSNWARREPDGGTVQNCAAVKNDTKWVDVHCKNGYPAFCMIRHQIGPREIDMSVKYHEPKLGPVIYSGRDVTYTCSAFMQEDDYVFLKIRDERRNQFDQTFVSMDPRNNSLGMCTNLTAVEITIKNGYPSDSSKVYTNRTFDCYTRQLDDYDEFTECQNKPMEFCRRFTFPMIIVDPPIENLTLNLTFTSDDVSAICLANVGSTGRLTWVLYFPSATQVLQDDDPRIRERTRDAVTKSSRWVEKSTLLLSYKVVKGIDVGCFDHSITEYNLTTTCDPEDMFCDIKQILATSKKVSSKKSKHGSHSTESSTNKFIIGGSLLLLVLGIIAGVLLLTLPRTVVAGNNEEAVYYDDAQYYVAEHDQPAYSEEQPAFDEEQPANGDSDSDNIDVDIKMIEETVVANSAVTTDVPATEV